MKAWILLALGSFAVHREDRDPEAKAAQFERVASSIMEHSRGSRWRAAMLVTLGRFESDWSLRIGSGGCRPGRECDGGRAVSNYQLHESVCSSPEAWAAASADIPSATREAARAIDRMRGMCRGIEREGGDITRAVFSALAGRGCRGNFRTLDARVATVRRLLGKP